MEGVGWAVTDNAEHERRAAQLAEELAWVTRERRRDNTRMLLGVVVSILIAIPMMAMSAHVTSEPLGRAWLYGGLLIGDLGVLVSVGWGLSRAVERGDAEW